MKFLQLSTGEMELLRAVIHTIHNLIPKSPYIKVLYCGYINDFSIINKVILYLYSRKITYTVSSIINLSAMRAMNSPLVGLSLLV